MLAALILIGGLLVGGCLMGTYAALRASARTQRQHERREQAWLVERRELLNRVMFLANHPWEYPDRPDVMDSFEEPDTIADPLLYALPSEPTFEEDEVIS